MSIVGTSGLQTSGPPAEPSFPPNFGPFTSEQEALNAIVERLAAGLQPLRIYLFGSRATGNASASSDFDLAVVLDDTDQSIDTDYYRAYEPLLGLGVGCDVIPCLWSEFQEVLADPTNPWQQVWASARLVYERRK
jgi:predicted nucleotidyltransferase